MAWPLAGRGSLTPGANDLDLTFARRPLQFPGRDMQEITPLPDAGSELAIAPADPLAVARPAVRWPVAIVVSGLLHAAAAAFFLISPAGTFDFRNAEQPEGSDHPGDKVAGSALDKDPAAISVTLEPRPQPTKPEPAARPVPPAKPAQPEREAVKQAPEPAREAAKPLPKPLPEAVKQPAATPDILVAATPRPDDQSVAARTETAAQPSVQADSAEMPVAVPDQPPIPSARPTPAAAPATASEAYEDRGTADGKEIEAAIASKGRKQGDTGNAAASRYSGEVASKLARANRRVSKSAQTTARNNALVAFVVLANGNIVDLQLAKSSGSPELDQFALDLVRKQAPFPPIPAETKLMSWRFKAPIGPFEP
ncbi:TonB family protein [Mesorhizobium huakuii]|uniref:TonB family protein n=1 Tax=Mesorhizobium huakuii TaxID=28104 RepID=A0ABZ0VQP4_9HYPH|nr:TonB family protein [Mesorhizobium huakuii]WQB99784.1 TonB family protein [Mesorhizobium huakuii]